VSLGALNSTQSLTDIFNMCCVALSPLTSTQGVQKCWLPVYRRRALRCRTATLVHRSTVCSQVDGTNSSWRSLSRTHSARVAGRTYRSLSNDTRLVAVDSTVVGTPFTLNRQTDSSVRTTETDRRCSAFHTADLIILNCIFSTETGEWQWWRKVV